MTKNEIERALNNLVNKSLIGIEYYDKEENGEDSYLKLLFSESYVLIVHTFWRMLDEYKIIAMDSERYLLSDYNAPEKDFRKLPFNQSLLHNNLEFVKTAYLNSVVKDITVSDTKDVTIKFNSSLILQCLINCRCNFYVYYGLICGKKDILQLKLNWHIN